jgi:class 3 adenylate cyclase/predicted ATPase
LLFTDVVGSTELGEARDPEAIRAVMDRMFALARAVIERHGGLVEKFVGDAVMAAFGLPQVREDDALRAIRAADEIRWELAVLNNELEPEWGARLAIRTGVNTGEVVTRDVATRQTFATGDAVNTAARLEQAAGPGEILISESTRWLVQDAVQVEPVEPLRLKGKADLVPAFRLLSVDPAAPGRRRPTVELIGRRAELDALLAALDRVETTGRATLALLVAEPGIGKTRLAEAFTASIREASRARVVTGHCVAYGEGATYRPVVELLREAAALDDGDAPDLVDAKLATMVASLPEDESALIVLGLRALLGPGGDVGQEQLFWAIRRTVERLAADGPLVLLLEDLHWAEETLMDLVDELAVSTAAPALVLGTARPDVIRRRRAWEQTNEARTVIRLGPLSGIETADLADRLAGTTLPPAARARVVAASGGNALYVAELLASARERAGGPDVDAWEVALARIGDTPAPLSAVIGARLELLAPEDRSLLEVAAVLGVDFSGKDLAATAAAIGGQAPDPLLDRRLQSLADRELLIPFAVGSTPRFRFRHALVHDVVYAGVVKRRRAEIHEAFGSLLEGQAGPFSELGDTIGFHLEQSVRFRLELGSATAATQALAARAAHHLATAGRAAMGRGDPSAAAGFLRRAADLLGERDAELAAVLIDEGSCLRELGRLDAAVEMLRQAAGMAEASGQRPLHLRGLAELLEVDYARRVPSAEILLRARALVPSLEQVGEHVGLNKAWRMIAISVSDAGHVAEAEHAQRTAADHARRAGDHRLEMETIPFLVPLDFIGPTPADVGLRNGWRILDEVRGNLRAEVFTQMWIAALLAMLGRTRDAWRCLEEADRLREELSLGRWKAVVLELRAYIALTMASPKDVRALRHVLESARGETPKDVGSVAAMLVWALVDAGRGDAVDDNLLAETETTPTYDLFWSAWAVAARARARATRGDLASAIEMAERAVAMVEDTDMPMVQADTRLALAEVRAARTGQTEGALIETALSMIRDKRDMAGLHRATRQLARVGILAYP